MPSAPRRVLSIDVVRGLTVAAMILVNDPGDPQQVYAPLRHKDWHGYTAADLVFPNFLFLSGVSLVYSLDRRGKGSRLELARALGRRSVNLIGLKIVLALVPTFRPRRIRIFGVLFRTAFCSLAGGLVLLRWMSLKPLLGAVAAILGSYGIALRLPFKVGGTQVNVPFLDAENNVAAKVDRGIARLLHGGLHTGALYNVTHDPEGLLGSIAATATVLLGACAALVLRDRRRTPAERAALLLLCGLALLLAGQLWHSRYPINKNLWTPSFVLVAGGWSAMLLGGSYLALDGRGRAGWLEFLLLPAHILGANALVVYALSVAGHKMLRMLHLAEGGHSLSLRTLAYRKSFARGGSTRARSLAFAVAYLAVCFVPALVLWRRKAIVRI